MIKRTYLLRVERSSKKGWGVAGTSWRLQEHTSFFAQPLKVLQKLIGELEEAFPDESMNVLEFRRV